MYDVGVISSSIENHFLNTKVIIKEQLKRDVKIHKGLKVNTTGN